MVRYLGAYHQEASIQPRPGHDNPQRISTHHILLEYGNRDLETLFFEEIPPILQNDIEAFWDNLFEVADAVSRIHNLTIEDDGIPTQYYG